MVFTAKKLITYVTILSLAACSSQKNDVDGTMTGRKDVNNAPAIQSQSIAPDSLAYFNQEIGNKIYFGYDQYTLSPEAKTNLMSQAAWIKQYAAGKAIVVEGHCDERGTREYNLGLGARRAASVRSFLISQGLNPAQIKGMSFGKERPEVMGSDAMSWAKNRRSVTVIQ